MGVKNARIKDRMRNSVLRRAIFDVWPSVTEFCREKGLNQCVVGKLLNLRESPIHKYTGAFTKTAQKIAGALGFSCSELFPLHLYRLECGVRAVVEISFDELPVGELQVEELSAGTTVHDEFVQRELEKAVREVLSTLTPKQEEVLRFRTGLNSDGRSWTLQEIGDCFGRTRESVRQVEATALKKLRHPSRAKRLQDFVLY